MRIASLWVPGSSIVVADDPTCGDETLAGVLLNRGCGAGRGEPVGSIDAASTGVNTGTAHASESRSETDPASKDQRQRQDADGGPP